MIVKTRKYKLENKTYIKIGMTNIVKEQWWVILIYLALNAGYFLAPSWWWFIGSTIALVLYVLFWVIQFVGVTQLDQNKMLFEKLAYEIDSRQILIKLNSKQGMPVTWDMIKGAQVVKDAFILKMSKAQFIHLPYKVFATDNERKFVESVLKRKGLVK
ncbi:YcxB family protein [Penaeicola halotolerans]|uniref:YcxB family protein n=1 Tax=Penaeicola halotolerans TaxID=2793196 RepID=UPI001CF89EF2|nr:YcxB family protein [Penaeicola halotolerans]